MNLTVFYFFISSLFVGTIHVEMEDSIHVQQGDVFNVIMSANHTTGFSWVWDKADSVNGVDSIGHRYEKSIDGLVVCGGTETWSFKAISKGVFSLKFRYVRPWDPKNPAQVKSVSLVVK
ncbi:protease inhibitor I42 family protein [Alistipes sp. ZOR0009]|uniref:protease inhibitor I42 family protein n=1 Tax=Alistipes sp. ZOR0009 TaxID=1339253 RepID=UPI0009DD948A|nr:protease inhibitor I42 family protein [Alistipes sp. ZOR0009]